MALVDLWFAEDKHKRTYSCALCVKNPATAIERKCRNSGFTNFSKLRKIDDYSLQYTFCPGKATWYEEITELFQQCRVAMETGIMPNRGSFEDQSAIFVEVFPAFVERWKDRNYYRVWADVKDFTKVVLEAVFGTKK